MSADSATATTARRLHALRDDLARAAAFLTRLPVRWPATRDPDALARALRLAPLVGAGVGGVGAGVYLAADALGLPALAGAALALAATILLTGGLHEDGLGDVADGFGGGRDVAGKLAVMRDSRAGSYAVAAIALSLLARAAALAALPAWPEAALALVAAHALSRAPFAATMRALPPARPDGLGASAGRPAGAAAATALVLGAVIAVAALGAGAGGLALLVALAVWALLGWLAMRQIGGYTGDVLGALQQAGEIAVLLTAAATLAP